MIDKFNDIKQLNMMSLNNQIFDIFRIRGIQIKPYHYLPEQVASLQLLTSDKSSFEQFRSHVRVLLCSQGPQVTLQLDHWLHVEKT